MGGEMRLGATMAAIVPGGGTAVVGPTLVALVDALPSGAVVETIWSVAEVEGTFDDVIGALGALGFADFPAMAVFGWEDDGCRVVIRGGIGLEVSGRDGMQIAELLGGSVRSWAEHSFDDIGSVRAWIGTERAATAEFLGYAIDRGIAPARGVDVLAPGTEVPRPKATSLGSRRAKATTRQAALEAAAKAEPLLSAVPTGAANVADPDLEAAAPAEPAEPLEAASAPPAMSLDTLLSVDVEPEAEPDEVAAQEEPTPAGSGTEASADASTTDDPPSRMPPAPEPSTNESGAFDHLWEATQHRSVEEAAMRASAEAEAASSAAPVPGDPDHDGLTVTAAELRALVGSDAGAAAPSDGPAGGHLAIRCPRNHLNPPHASSCRACGQPVRGQTPVRVATIDLGAFRFRDGTRVPVRKPMLMGRSPKMSGPIAGEIPEMVQIDSPAQDISRTHLEVRVEGWQVLVIDRDSTNGTIVSLPGREPQRLRPYQPVPLPIGASVDLAGEAEFTFEVGP